MTRRLDFLEAGTRDIEEADSAWIYDTAPGAGLGQLHVEDLMLSAGTTPIRRTYAYDDFGRVSSVTSEITRAFVEIKILSRRGVSVWGIAKELASRCRGGANFNSALTSGFFQGVTAGAFSAIASKGWSFIGDSRLLTQSLSFGVVGGVTSALQGGRFGHGFLSAGLGAPLGFGAHSLVRGVAGDLASRIVTPLIVGGTVSELTGGKFANGAAYAAFSMTMEGVATVVAPGKPNFPTDPSLTPAQQQRLLRDQQAAALAIDQEYQNGNLDSGRIYASIDDAANAVLAITEPIGNQYNVEIGGKIEATRTGFRYARPFVGLRGSMPGMSAMHDFVAGYHTHPNVKGKAWFSLNDAQWVQQTQRSLFMRGNGVSYACDFGSSRCSYTNALVNPSSPSNRALRGRQL